MYFFLLSRGKLKIHELAQEIEVSERNIRRYRDELEMAGIKIDSETGKYGGYQLVNDNLLLELNIDDYEFHSLLLVDKLLKDTKHIASNDISTLLEKISILKKEQNFSKEEFSNHMTKVVLSNSDRRTERKMLMDIHSASLFKKKIIIKYTSLTTGITERTVHPYATYQYKGDMYFVGYCELKNELRDFKMSRICEYEILAMTFKIDNKFDLVAYMKNSLGIYKGKEYKVKLRIQNPIAQTIKEKIWVENQSINDVGDGVILYEARMRGLEEIKTWILGMGSCVEVLGSDELVCEIKNEINKMSKIYL